jgi:DNA polymerase elongation subunit (family B)
MLELLSQAPDAASLPEQLPELRRLVRKRLAALRSGRVPPEKLVVRQTLSRELERYRSPSPAAQAARQLEETGRSLRPGQAVRMLYTLGDPGIRAWDVAEPFEARSLDIPYYTRLFGRAVETITQPFGSRYEPEAQPFLSGMGRAENKIAPRSIICAGRQKQRYGT